MGQLRAHPSRGITLPELLVVVSIMGLALAVAIPTVSRAIKVSKVRTAVNQMAISLQAARMAAVNMRETVDFVVATDSVSPGNFYEYSDGNGRMRHVDMPAGVQITAISGPLEFRPNGSIAVAVVTTIETRLDRNTVEVWEVRTSGVGVTTTERVSS